MRQVILWKHGPGGVFCLDGGLTHTNRITIQGLIIFCWILYRAIT